MDGLMQACHVQVLPATLGPVVHQALAQQAAKQ